MDIQNSQNTYRYVPRRRPKTNTSQNTDKHRHHGNKKHHSNEGHRHHSNGGHHHHSNGGPHHNQNNLKQQDTNSLIHHLDNTIDSKHDHSTSDIIHTEHKGHNHVTSAGVNNHDIQQQLEHFDHEIAMNHSIHHHHMHSNSDHIHNTTNLRHHHAGVLNSTMTIMPHGGNHHRHHNIHDHKIHSKVNQGHAGHMMEGEGHHHGMQMYFSMKTDSYFLLEGLKISSTEGILCAMLFTIALTIIMETLASKIHLRERHRKHLNGFSSRLGYHFVTSVTHLINVGLAYIGMLCVMSMNIWLLVSVIVGSGVGHLLMKPMLQSCCSKPQDHVTLVSGNGKLMDTDEELLRNDTSTAPNGHMTTETDTLMT